MKKACIIGAYPIKNTSFLKTREKDSFLVACDGGYKTFIKENIEPSLFVGDFDTLKKETLIHPKEVIELNPIKDDTDTLFSIKKCLSLGYDTFYLYGCSNGKIDHYLANIQILSFIKEHKANGYLIDIDNNIMIFLLKDSSITLNECDGMISILSYSDVSIGVTLENLMYTLNNETLTNSFPLGISNQFIKNKKAKISVKEGSLLIIAPIDCFKID